MFGKEESVDAGSDLAKPTKQQAAWQDLELGLFVHLGMYSIQPQIMPNDYGNYYPPDKFHPDKIDTDQWMEVAKSFGAKYAVLTAKHYWGYCLWPTKVKDYEYSIKHSKWRNGKGDIVRMFVDSCHKYGIKPGIYCASRGNGHTGIEKHGHTKYGKAGTVADREAHNRMMEQMLTELWSNYGELVEIWFDGGVLPAKHGGPNIEPILDKHQPNAMVLEGSRPHNGIRWAGNERGTAPYPCWSTANDFACDGGNYKRMDPNGKIWLPGECDATLPGYGWSWGRRLPFKGYNRNPTHALMNMYLKSVGRNCNLLLNAAPNPNGLIEANELPLYTNFGKELQRCFGKSVAETSGEGDTVELDLKQPTRIDYVGIMEDILQGERVRAYEVEGLVPGNKWQKLCEGTSIGHKRIQYFPATEVAKVRLRVLKSVATPKIRRLAVFNPCSST